MVSGLSFCSFFAFYLPPFTVDGCGLRADGTVFLVLDVGLCELALTSPSGTKLLDDSPGVCFGVYHCDLRFCFCLLIVTFYHLRFTFYVLGCRVQGAGCRVQGAGCRV